MGQFLKYKHAFLLCLFVGMAFAWGLLLRQVSTAASTQVRLALVNVPDDLIKTLLPGFKKESGYDAEIVYTGNDPFAEARNGKADLVISHYGHEGTEPFVSAGFGLWPHPVFANQMALMGPPADPAHVRGLTDAVVAFRRIAEAKAPFLSNNGAGARYLEDILWISAGRPDKGDWYIRSKSEGRAAAREASEKGAYMLWGVPPFLRLKRQTHLNLAPLVVADPLFQRIMVSIVVNPAKIKGVNAPGAAAFQDYLISPATQARIRAFRYPDLDQQVWWPAGRHNNTRD
jgi:tungstate transport system substrate-binding protein